jgi:S1-C subfamily serine protease
VRRLGRAALGLTLAVAAVTSAGGATREPSPRFDPGRAQEVPTAVSRVSPAVVGIRARIPSHRPSAATLGTERWGSGVLIEPDGTILTVGYLVMEASALDVVFHGGRTAAARVVGHDFESGFAVLRAIGGGPYPVAMLGRSGSVSAGQPVSVVGVSQDRGLLARSARVTMVRRFVAYWEYLVERALITSPSHPAFGGAAVVNPDGDLVGIMSLRLEGENLAIPIDLFPPVREALLAQGRPARPPRPWLGVRAVAMDGGVVIAGVSPVGPAHAAGLKDGDVIVRLNGDRVADLEDFYQKLWRTRVGSAVELGLYRDGQLQTVTLRPRDRYEVFQFRSPAP